MSGKLNSDKEISTLNHIFRALHYRNFRLFFFGQGVSLVGTWIQQIAMSWLVYRLTGSAFILGVVSFSSQIPTFLFSPFTGVLADRWNRHRMLLVTQTLSMVQALTLAFLIWQGTIAVWHIIILGFMLGCINSVDIPARQSFLIDMVEQKELLGNAIALNSFMFNGARLIGPVIAGVLITLTGEGACFLINGLSFLAVIACLWAMEIKKQEARSKNAHAWRELQEGIRYTFGFAPIRSVLALVAMISLMGASYVVLMPVFAKNILYGGPKTLGFLMAAVGVGALIATIYLASRRKILKLGPIIPVAASIFAFGLIAFSFSRVLWLSLFLLTITGFGFMVHMAASNTIIQTIVEDDKRGRVMSFYMMAFMGVAPMGSLLAGFLANIIGAPNALALGGVACFLAALAFASQVHALQRVTGPIYEKLSAVPEAVTAVDTVAE
ncbi:MAG TPA: MFS transporter [Candidatus Omnitrophota bacterium]|nr:MFS transporter [Candidatus Omnitrophota bacterium]HPD85485.1 MFS transporter [Candidatus Omnitrophota bacterium]HRZ04014.1 MFS transporter [Candidatus Omnitrophota bacterium]